MLRTLTVAPSERPAWGKCRQIDSSSPEFDLVLLGLYNTKNGKCMSENNTPRMGLGRFR